eukprot:gene7101-205_t
MALKLHRLGRTSFRAVRSKRDYLSKTAGHFSWLYLSRLSALKEFAFMKALGEHGFPVPVAIDSNRHAVLMTLVDAVPMIQVRKLTYPGQVYLTCMELMSRLAAKGLVHCDFNEFNLLISDDDELTLIDFPQMVSVCHANAKELFERDVECIIRYFTRKIGYDPELDEALPYVRPVFEDCIKNYDDALDVATAASGFQKDHQRELEAFTASQEGGPEPSSPQEGEGDGASSVDGLVSGSEAGEDREEEETASVVDTGFTMSVSGERRRRVKGSELGDKGIQAKTTAERQKAIRREALMKAARNTNKVKGKGGKGAKGKVDSPSFGGW